MKNINTDLIKDFFISLLIVVIILLIVSIFFYDKFSLSKVIPKVEQYELTDEMQEDLNGDYDNVNTSVVTSYYIKSSELKEAEKTKEYNKGKRNPFKQQDTSTEIVLDANNSSNSEELVSGNTFYKDDGTK